MVLHIADIVAEALSQLRFHTRKVRPEVVDSKGSRKHVLITSREQLDQMAEVGEPVVDGRCREHEHSFSANRRLQQIK